MVGSLQVGGRWIGSDSEGACVVGNLFAQTVAHDGAHWHQAGVRDGVVRRGTVRAARDDASVVQHPEVLGHVGLAGAESVDEFADVLLAIVEQRANDPEARRVAEHAEPFGDVIEQFGRERLRHGQHSITIER